VVLKPSARLLYALSHMAHGAWVVHRHFPAANAGARQRHVAWWSAKMLRLLGVQLDVAGAALANGPVLIVSNHVSWLDILVVHALCPQARFVSKSGVQHWPLVGRLTLAVDTLFIERESKRDALRVVHHMAEALRGGDTVAVFPEGTTSDGRALLPFHANLLQAALAAQAPVQAWALRYADAQASPSQAAAYVGDTTLVASLWQVVRARNLRVQVHVHAPMSAEGRDRRSLAQAARDLIDQTLRGQA
jgi:1-acyl-sn-glycerol-3-phosphate acyltransferase